MVRILLVFVLFVSDYCLADEKIHVAVTASFKPVIEAMAKPFFDQSHIKLVISSASTGILYQQILKGAPFDVFFSADSVRPALLIEQLGLPASQLFTYALGQLVLISHSDSVTTLDDLRTFSGKIIIANPVLAPYGFAAQQVLQGFDNKSTLVQANNVAQARQYLSLKLAKVGLISASLADGFDSVVEVPSSMYDVIEQQGIVLKPIPQVAVFLEYLNTPNSQKLIQQMGYQLPVN